MRDLFILVKIYCLKQTVIGFGLIVFAVLVLVQLARFSHFQSGMSLEVWIVIFSIVFLGLGFFLSRKLSVPKVITEEIIVEKRASFTIDEKQVEKLNLSKREYEMLQLINEGLSNQQIADKLFVSENTVKKHISNLFLKMDVERRTEAVKKGKDLRIIS